MRRCRLRGAILAGAAAALAALGAHAATSTLEECVEGSDFIANAAHARDHGMSRANFLDRLDGDFVAIRAFPVALRWFVKDRDDERFLRAAVEGVFDRPQAADRHHAAFFDACVRRAAA